MFRWLFKDNPKPDADGEYFPRNIWLLWLQGWDTAPAVVQAARTNWQKQNQTWKIHFLDRESLSDYLPDQVLRDIFSIEKLPNTFADQVRLELLHRYGGVWTDATTLCAEPLDDWLPQRMKTGFFAFSKPSRDRMLSNWFLASRSDSYILQKWREKIWEYWSEHSEMHTYFWMHGLFHDLYESDAKFRSLWDKTPEISAQHRFHFGPDAEALFAEPPADIEDALASPPAPVFKLTHKFTRQPGTDSLFDYLCRYAER